MNHRVSLCVAAALAIGCNKAPADTPATPAPAAPPAAQAPAAAPAAKPVPAQLPDVVARINGEAIARAEFESVVKGAETRAGNTIPADRRDAIYRSLLDQLVGYKLLTQESKARNLVVPEEDVKARVGEIRKQFPTEEAYKQALSAQGITPEKLAQETRKNLMVGKLVDSEVSSKVVVGPEDVAQFYEQNKNNFKEDESVRASHILIGVAKGADEAAKKKAREQAESVLKQLKGGGDFAALAKQHSQDPGSAPKGGDLGFFGKGRMVPPFDAAAFALKPGELSGVVESPFGFHIIRVMEKKPARQLSLDETRGQIQQQLTQQQRFQKTQAFIEQLKAKGKVEILI